MALDVDYSTIQPYLKQLSIIAPTGLLMCHKAFSQEKMDSVLFSGFTSAIVSFSGELGLKLKTIDLDKLLLFIKKTEGLIVVVGTASIPGIHELVDELLQRMEQCGGFEQIKAASANPLGIENEIIDELLSEVFSDRLNMPTVEETPRALELQEQIRQYIRNPDSSTITPKQIAELICDTDMDNQNSENRLETINLIRGLLESDLPVAENLQHLEDLLKYLESRAFNASKKISKALF